MPFTPQGILKAVVRLSPWVILSKTLGFSIPFVIAYLYGVSWVTDTFFYTLAIPTFIVVITANSASNVYLPALTLANQVGGNTLAQLSLNVAQYTAALSTVLAIFVGLVTSLLLFFTPNQTPESLTLSVQFWGALLPYVFCIGLNASFKPSCDVLGQFIAAPISGIARALVVLVVLVSGESVFGVLALPVSFSLGEVTRSVLLWWWVQRTATPVTLSVRPTPETIEMLWQTRPLLVAELLIASTIVSDKIFSSWLDTGQLSVLEYSDKLRLAPQLLIEATLIPIAFTSWAALFSRKQVTAMMDSVQRMTAQILLILTPILCICMIWRIELVQGVLGGTGMMPQHLAQIAELFGAFLPGVLFLVVGTFAFKIHVLHRRWRLILTASGLAATLNMTLNFIWFESLGIAGIVLASLVAWGSLAVLYQWKLRTAYPKTYRLGPELFLSFSTTSTVCLISLLYEAQIVAFIVLAIGTSTAIGLRRFRHLSTPSH